jgi:trehalose 6-phosphate phosphatase
MVEEKRFSTTIHYRQVRDKARVRAAIDEAIRALPDVRAIGGTEAINLLPHGGPNKGVALQQARKLFACDTAIYVGDDGTDEDAFGSAPPDRLLGIRVGGRGASAARYRLRNQQEIDGLLEALVECRSQ